MRLRSATKYPKLSVWSGSSVLMRFSMPSFSLCDRSLVSNVHDLVRPMILSLFDGVR